MKQDYYKNLLTDTINQENSLEKNFNTISSLRLILFSALAISYIIGFYEKLKLWYFIGVLFTIIFCILIYFHSHLNDERLYIKSKREVLEKYLKRFNNGWKEFDLDGSEYLSDKYPQAKDLDLFGKASLYQYICVARTFYGKDKLADSLLNSNLDKKRILKRQEAIKELAQKKEFSIKFETLINLIDTAKGKREDLEKFLEYSESNSKLNISAIKLCSWLPIFITLVSIILFKVEILSIIFVYISVLLQILIGFWGGIKATPILSPMYSFRNSIEEYKKIIIVLEEEDFKSRYLKQLQRDLSLNLKASKAIYILSSIVEASNLKYSPFVYLFASIILMWDYQCIKALESWKNNYGNKIRKWLNIIGEIEDLLSFSIISSTKENVSFPIIIDQPKPKLKIIQVNHPLIEESKAVTNSITLQSNPCIITGSNMSGKTTFLRSIGLNMILCYAGSCVCAKNFETTCMSIFTSMRIQDNVSQGISTFYAEILRIKSIMEYSPQKQPMIVLIDEIFKGTNSADRIIGAKEVVRKLSQDWIISIITTHDFELCDLENDSSIKAVNYHFSEYYEKNKIKFDYTIKNGRCRTTNAKQLMKMAGIL